MKFGLEGGGNLLLETGEDFLFEEPWPDDALTGTNYYLSNAGNDAWAGTSKATAWATPAHANSALSGATGDVAVSLRSGDTFSGTLTAPAGASSFTVQGRLHDLLMTTVGNASTVSLPSDLPILTGSVYVGQPNTKYVGVNIDASGQSYGVNVQAANVDMSYCRVGGASLDFNIAAPHYHIHWNTIGGMSATSPDQVGLYPQWGSWDGLIEHNDIGFVGGDPGNPTQSGFGIHVSGQYDFTFGWNTTPVALTWSNGIPTNALLRIWSNIIHDCGGNITSGFAGSTSACELGSCDRIDFANNAVLRQRPVVAWYGGYDMVGFDADGGCTNICARGNWFEGCFGAGMLSYDSGNCGPLYYFGNITVDCGYGNEGNIDLQGNGNSGNQNFWNNTSISSFTNYGAGPQNIQYYEMQNSSGEVANNIFWTIGTTLAAYAFKYPGVVTDHNCWYGGSGFDWGRGSGSGTGYPLSFATWSAMYNADANGITSDPLFVGTAGSTDPADYALQMGSPCIGTGVDVVSTLGLPTRGTYFDGTPIPSGAPNMGAMG